MRKQLVKAWIMIVALALVLSTTIWGCGAATARQGSTVIATRTRNAYGHWPRHDAYNQRVRQGHVDLIFIEEIR